MYYIIFLHTKNFLPYPTSPQHTSFNITSPHLITAPHCSPHCALSPQIVLSHCLLPSPSPRCVALSPHHAPSPSLHCPAPPRHTSLRCPTLLCLPALPHSLRRLASLHRPDSPHCAAPPYFAALHHRTTPSRRTASLPFKKKVAQRGMVARCSKASWGRCSKESRGGAARQVGAVQRGKLGRRSKLGRCREAG